MKHILLILFILSSTSNLFGQPNISWERSLGGTNGEISFGVNETTDGGFIVVGYSSSGNDEVNDNNGSTDIWVVKLDVTGNIVWENNYGGSDTDKGHYIEQTADGGYILIGTSRSDDFAGVNNFNNYDDIVILKLDNLGTMQWGKFYGSTGPDIGYSIKQTADGGYIAAGTIGGDSIDLWIAKLDVSGNIDPNWTNTTFGGPVYGTPTNPQLYNDGAYSVDIATDGYVVCGFTQREGNSGNSQNDYWIIKFDFNGSFIWETILGGDASEEAKSIISTNDGGYIIAGYTRSDEITGGNSLRDYWIVKLDIDGELVWETALGGSQNDEAASIDLTSDNGYIVLGFSRSNDGDVSGSIIPNSEKDYWLVKLDVDGDLDWEKSLGGWGDDDGFYVKQTTDGGYILTGTTTSSNIDIDPDDRSGTSDYWVVKLESETLDTENIPNDTAITVFPNPFKTQVTIELPSNYVGKDLTIGIFNQLGKKIMNIDTVADNPSIKINSLEVLSAGIYFLKLTDSKSKNQTVFKLIKN